MRMSFCNLLHCPVVQPSEISNDETIEFMFAMEYRTVCVGFFFSGGKLLTTTTGGWLNQIQCEIPIHKISFIMYSCWLSNYVVGKLIVVTLYVYKLSVTHWFRGWVADRTWEKRTNWKFIFIIITLLLLLIFFRGMKFIKNSLMRVTLDRTCDSYHFDIN